MQVNDVAFSLGDTAYWINCRSSGWRKLCNPLSTEFTLVSEFQMLPLPVHRLKTTEPKKLNDDGNLVFTIKFTEAVTGFSLSDIEVIGGTKEDFVTGESDSYTVTVKPASADTKVTVKIAADAVMDSAENGNKLEKVLIHQTATWRSVTITAADGTGDDEGKVIFTLNFSEAPNAFSIASLSVTGAAAPGVTDLVKLVGDEADEDSAATYTLTVTPTADATEVKVSIAAGVLSATENKGDEKTSFFASSEGMHTVTPSAIGTGLATGDSRNDLSAPAEFALTGTLASNSFAVFAADATNGPAGSTAIPNLPNLQRFFAKGGTISLVGGSGAAGAAPNKSVVISEIMWGLNLAVVPAMQADYQWIELLNTDNPLSDIDDTNAAAAAINLAAYKLVFTPGTVVPKPAKLSDQISNVEFVGWDVNIGQSGKLGAASTTFTPEDLVSMYRGINYENLTKKHGDKNAADNRVEQLKAIPGGSAASGWAESTVNDTYAVNQVGSPGAQHFEGRPTTSETTATYGVVINEVGNNTGDSYDWIELLNTGTTDAELKNWEITQITEITDTPGTYTETALVTIPDVSHKIPAGGILLVVNSDPYRDPDHPVAAGTIINSDKLREQTTGISSRYYVSSGLKLRDDGKMALLVRDANNKEKEPTNVIDFTGPRPFNNIVDLSSKFRTNQWPLRAQGVGSDNVLKDLDEDFRTGRIYQRNKKDAGNAAETWVKAGYSGVGYKRGASGDGTPGYANGIVQENETKLAAASAGATVTISEIMYDRGDRDNLPQWIELYNSSDTHAVNLNEWKLKIENADDVDVRRPATIANLGGTIIPPNQTVLIVAYTTGRVSRGSQGRDDFPSKRVITLSGKAELEIAEDATKRNYRLLSETAFQLTLIEKGGTAGVDTAGNLGADGTAMWALPMAEDGAGRSSIIRRYYKDVDTNGDPIGLAIDRDGTMIPPADGTGAWVLASTSDLSEVQVNETYYGSPDDVGTPGYRGGGALPVSLSKFRPERLDSGEIVVRWITESELNNAGFNILRSEKRDGEFTKLNTKLIAGQGTTSERIRLFVPRYICETQCRLLLSDPRCFFRR